MEAKTRWKLFECGRGNRWASAFHDYTGEVCPYTGCGCRTLVRRAGETTSRAEAFAWAIPPLREPETQREER
jgi:hypothetical protein